MRVLRKGAARAVTAALPQPQPLLLKLLTQLQPQLLLLTLLTLLTQQTLLHLPPPPQPLSPLRTRACAPARRSKAARQVRFWRKRARSCIAKMRRAAAHAPPPRTKLPTKQPQHIAGITNTRATPPGAATAAAKLHTLTNSIPHTQASTRAMPPPPPLGREQALRTLHPHRL